MAEATILTNQPHRRQPPHDTIARAIEANLADYWLRLGTSPGGEVHSDDSIKWEYSGSPFLNRVVESHLTAETVDLSVKSIKREFERRRAAVTWFVCPSVTPSNLGQKLLHHGFSRYDDWIGMAHSLCGLGEPPPVAENVCIEKVTTEAQRNEWTNVVGRSFSFPRSARERLRLEFESHSGDGDATREERLLAYVSGEPAAACSLFVKDGVAGIYLVSTLPEQRGQGLGSYITWTALARCRDLGCHLAVLQSTAEAESVYRSLGFCSHSRIQVYRYGPPSPLWKCLGRRVLRQLKRSWLSRSQRRNPRRDTVAVEEPAAAYNAH